jgi:hypothetical protein
MTITPESAQDLTAEKKGDRSSKAKGIKAPAIRAGKRAAKYLIVPVGSVNVCPMTEKGAVMCIARHI